MSELTRAEIKALLDRSAELIRQAQAIQAELHRALATAPVLAPVLSKRRPAARRKTARKIPK